MNEHFFYISFIKNKYYKWYCGIIDSVLRENRTYCSGIHENHHPLPKSLGGSYTVPLTFREHYICHELLTRFTVGKDRRKMCFALHTFFHFDMRRPNASKKSVLYSRHKKTFIEVCKNRIPWTKKDIFIFKHMKTCDEFVGTRQEFLSYSGITNQEIYNLLDKGLHQKIRWNSKSWGIYISDLQLFSFELERTPVDLGVIECVYCNKKISPGNHSRWHGSNCKNRI